MEDKKNNHKFTVDLTGLNLPEEHLQRISAAIQKTVLNELASVDFKVSKTGGWIGGFHPPHCGLIYRSQLPPEM